MPVPSTSGNFPDVLDPQFQDIFTDQYKQLPDRIGEVYIVVSGAQAPRKDQYQLSTVGAFGDVPEFTGSVTYDDVNQGYDLTITDKEYATGFQVRRKLFDDDLTGIMNAKPAGMSTAYARTRQKHAAQLFNNGFSIDTTWLSHSEGVALFSNSHTTNAAGVSTTTGFDNLVTTGFSATALAAARIQMRGFRGDRGERISIMPDRIIHPPDIYDLVFEVTQSEGKPGVATNEANVHRGVYTNMDWEYLDDANDWFLVDSMLMKNRATGAYWVDRVAMEFAMVEDFDTLIGKWRLYVRYGAGYVDWRWSLGGQVT